MKGKMNHPIDRLPLEEFTEGFLNDHKMTYSLDVLFYRIRLPWSQAGPLMRRLRQEAVNGATIYPGYNGIATALKEEVKFGK
jgi:hypothetical protein